MLSLIYTWLSLPRLDRKGVTALEYAVLAFAIVSIIYVGASAMANGISGAFSTIGTWVGGMSAPS